MTDDRPLVVEQHGDGRSRVGNGEDWVLWDDPPRPGMETTIPAIPYQADVAALAAAAAPHVRTHGAVRIIGGAGMPFDESAEYGRLLVELLDGGPRTSPWAAPPRSLSVEVSGVRCQPPDTPAETAGPWAAPLGDPRLLAGVTP
jgi:hypothetical protein